VKVSPIQHWSNRKASIDFIHVLQGLQKCIGCILFKKVQQWYNFIEFVVLIMAYITARKLQNGKTRYKAQIVIKKEGVIIARPNKTFDSKKEAKRWADQIKFEYDGNKPLQKREILPIKEILEEYLKQYPSPSRTKNSDIKKLIKTRIAQLDINTLTSQDIIEHIKERNTVCSPQTANNDLIWLNLAITTMRSYYRNNYEFNLDEIFYARMNLRSNGYIARSNIRDRRPTQDELDKLLNHFDGHFMHYIIRFQIHSCRRISETCRLEWSDINHENKTCILRNLKDPRKRNKNAEFKIPKEAYEIIQKHGKQKGKVFPYNPKTISSYFTKACKLLEIYNLHLHDLRHEGTTRLFEKGLSIVDAQLVTLHSNWDTLKRYTHKKASSVEI
jgi:integrase